MGKKIIKIIIIMVIMLFFKLLITNFWGYEDFYWDSFDFDLKNRKYLLQWQDGCEILEIGVSKNLYNDKIYYGKVSAGGVALAVNERKYDDYICEEEYFIIGYGLFLYKDKETLLKNIKSKEYRVIKPQIFFLVSFY